MKLRHTIPALALALLLTLVPSAWASGKYRVLHSFGSGSDGCCPYGPPLMDSEGNLYGVTIAGGGSGCGGGGCGTVFELTPQGNGKWTEQILHDFQDNGDGAYPVGNLVQDAAGNLYGAQKGHYERNPAIFELSPGSGGWNFSIIYTHGGGCLVHDQVGDLYGCIPPGGVGELSPGPNGWVYTDLTDQTTAVSPLSWDSKGNLYGADPVGGNDGCGGIGCGTAFQLTPNGDGTWNYHVIHVFGSWQYDGISPTAGLVLDTAGNAYGATGSGGRYNCGNVFKLEPSSGPLWKETVLHNFYNYGCAPLYTLALDPAGALYGMAQGGDPNCGPCGLIFKLAPQKNGKWKYSVLHTFHRREGADPYGVILDGKGNIFGTTYDGGKYGAGVAFEITQ